MNEEVIQNIRSRIEQCRRLAGMITDKRAAEILLQMARDGEEDIKRLQARAVEDDGRAATE